MDAIIMFLWFVIFGCMGFVAVHEFVNRDSNRSVLWGDTSDFLERHEFYQLEDVDTSDEPRMEIGVDWLDFPNKREDWRWYHWFTTPLLTILIVLAQVPIIKHAAEWILSSLLDFQWNAQWSRHERQMKKWRRDKVKEARRRRELGIETPVRKERPVPAPLTRERPVRRV